MFAKCCLYPGSRSADVVAPSGPKADVLMHFVSINHDDKEELDKSKAELKLVLNQMRTL